ncbi:hypothetical protein V1634_27830 [Plantactinospora veratri]|uniref:Uncharacterized protein n=1 Tax=Plantactinospora veratri TaxID=1436122 RepID=A0ABU7SL15_9ACTN
MGFFDRPAVAPDPQPEPPAPPRPAWMKPEAVFPGVVAEHRLLAHTDSAAIAITGLLAYPEGFEFTVTAVLRTPDRRPGLRQCPVHLKLAPSTVVGTSGGTVRIVLALVSGLRHLASVSL